MSNIIVIEKNGDIKLQQFDNFKESELYKKCGFRKSEGFSNVAEWNVKSWRIMVYARTQGKSGQENTYDFPPPIDTRLFFGNVGILCYDKDDKLSADESTWKKLYEELFGGFENLDDTAHEDENEEEKEDREAGRQEGSTAGRKDEKTDRRTEGQAEERGESTEG